MQQSSILIFIKNAVKGKVKTRLAASVGDDKALKIYKALLAHTRDIVTPLAAERHLFYSDQINLTDEWPNDLFHKHLQEGEDLGARIGHAFQRVFQTSAPALIIGSDCASLRTEIIEQAFKHLQDKEFVIGPALDGGYYLLGMRSYQPSLFDGIHWSSPQVLQQTLDAIQRLNGTYALLPELSDIDYEEDWQRYGWELD
ncbi:MAG: TIGR04282 family arsenosugar biosynthesis glycosyltransferase [Bacteroidota bacterium]